MRLVLDGRLDPPDRCRRGEANSEQIRAAARGNGLVTSPLQLQLQTHMARCRCVCQRAAAAAVGKLQCQGWASARARDEGLSLTACLAGWAAHAGRAGRRHWLVTHSAAHCAWFWPLVRTIELEIVVHAAPTDASCGLGSWRSQVPTAACQEMTV